LKQGSTGPDDKHRKLVKAKIVDYNQPIMTEQEEAELDVERIGS
jgi:hypothetical protein